MKNGVDQAAADINAAGGMLGQKIKLLRRRCFRSKAGRFGCQQVCRRRCQVRHRPLQFGVTIPASEVYQENGILQITPASTNPTFTERKMWNIFRVCGRDDQQGRSPAPTSSKHFKGKKIAIVHDKTTYGKGLADETKKAINKGG